MKTSYFIFFITISIIIAPLPLSAQPTWTHFTYTNWSPDSAAAISGGRAYDSATVWDGDKFVTFFQGAGLKYLTASSSNGQNWSYLNAGSPISITNLFSYGMGNHTVACEPDVFPAGDVMWMAQSENVHFKMWYTDTSSGDNLQYAESTGGINWQAFTEGYYCPPSYKTDTNQYMTKPSVLYRPGGETDLTTDNPMDNRYLMYLNSAQDLDPYYFELYISSNGLDWTLYGWDSYCESRFSSETIFEDVTFTGDTEPDYVDTFEEVFTNGDRDGWMLWTHNGDTGPIASWYSTNGYAWVFREEPINGIGELNSQTGYWNENANLNLDSVRLGNNYFFLRSGMTDYPSTKFQLGAAIIKGPISAYMDDLPSRVWENVPVTYRLFSWNNQTCPHIEVYFSIASSFWPDATEGSGGDGKENLAAGLGGTSHTFIWNSTADLPQGWDYVKFRLIPMVSYPVPLIEGEYDTTGPFSVNLPTPTTTPEGYKTPSPTPSAPPTPSTTPTPKPTSTPSVTPTAKPTPSLTPTVTPSPEPPPPESPTPTVIPPTPTFTPTPKPTASPTPSIPPTPTPTASPPSLIPPWIYDYDGDGTSDIGIFRGSSGLWAIRGITRVYFGVSTDETVPGDYDGDGTTDIGIFRPSSGLWAIRGVSRIYFGGSSDDLVQGDYNGNGTWSVGIFRPSSGLWAIRGITRVYFGGSSDEPVSGYYAGGLSRKIGIFRSTSSLWAIRGITRIYFGSSSDEIVPGDYDGSGTWATGIFRPSSGLWAIRGTTRVYFGGSSDTTIPGDYTGTGQDDIGIFRPSSGLWAIRGTTRVYFGGSSDQPVVR